MRSAITFRLSRLQPAISLEDTSQDTKSHSKMLAMDEVVKVEQHAA